MKILILNIKQMQCEVAEAEQPELRGYYKHATVFSEINADISGSKLVHKRKAEKSKQQFLQSEHISSPYIWTW